jgi:hypothetical protein
MDMIFKTLQVKATTVSVRLRIFSLRVNKYQQSQDHFIMNIREGSRGHQRTPRRGRGSYVKSV